MWGYYWEYTSAQIELMVVDTPIIVYDRKPKGKSKRKPRISKEEVEAKKKEWEKKYRNGNTGTVFDLGYYSSK